jgi:hypothetical protein
MKLHRVSISGFRGTLPKLELRLDCRSLCLLGENGHGKTTIADALELWGTGDLAAYHRAGVALDAAVHVDADEARISCRPSGFPTLTRTLAGRTASALVPERKVPGDALPPRIPMLRHRTMAAFMDQTAGDKLKALLELVGLGGIIAFRATAVTVANRLKADAVADARAVTAEQQVLDLETEGATIVDTAERLRVVAGLPETITTESNLLDLELGRAAPVAQPDRPALVADLARALERLNPGLVSEWNALVADLAITQAGALETLVQSGIAVVSHWPEDRCPLCLQDKPRDVLGHELAARVVELAGRTASLRAGKQALDEYLEQLQAVGTATKVLRASSPTRGWPASAGLESAHEALRMAWRSARKAAQQRTSVAPVDIAPLVDALPSLRDAAVVAGDTSALVAALASLVRLQMQVRRLRDAEAVATCTGERAAAMSVFRERADAAIRTIIEALLDDIGQCAADYYGRLVGTALYSNVQLDYPVAQAGGIEFTLIYNSEHRITPPQRVMSESQLNALGLALFLAQLKTHDAQPWRTLVLDDVVNSFDAIRRGAIAQLLTEEFQDWQVVVLTHDPIFASYNRQVLHAGWLHREIIGWSPGGGITIADGEPLEQLRKRLAAGDAASQLGGIARRALEHELARPVERLGLKLPFYRNPRYTAADFLNALKHATKKSNMPLPVLDRIGGRATSPISPCTTVRRRVGSAAKNSSRSLST